MQINDKMAILADLYIYYFDKPAWRAFFYYNNVGLPLAYLLNAGVVELADEEKTFYIEETYELLCTFLHIDPEEEYDSLREMILESPMMK